MKTHIVAGIVSAGLLLVFGSMTIAQRKGPVDQSVQRRQVHALHREGLRSAAAVTGSYVGEAEAAEWGSPSSLQALVASSEVVVVARVVHNRAYLTRDELSILTHYSAAVEEVVKGSLKVGQSISLIIPGGRVGFPGGSWAQLNLKGFIRPYDGQAYVLFLRPAASLYGREEGVGPDSYMPIFGPLGVYHMVDDKPIFPAGSLRTPLGSSIVRARLAPRAFIGAAKEASVGR